MAVAMTNKWEQFGRWCFDEARREGGGDIDGGAAQDKMMELGLLHKVVVTEPCGENCYCVEYHGEFPCECTRPTGYKFE